MLVDEEPELKFIVCEPLLIVLHVVAALVFWKFRPDERDWLPAVALSPLVLDDAFTIRTLAVGVGLVVFELPHAASPARSISSGAYLPIVGRSAIATSVNCLGRHVREPEEVIKP
jgi:hypothetical protein